MSIDIKESGSWILKKILKLRSEVSLMQQWNKMNHGDKFAIGTVYCDFLKHYPMVDWRVMVCHNKVRPRVVFVLCLVCQNKLATKDRLAKFGVNTYKKCAFCNSDETIHHLIFECSHTKKVWEDVLCYLNTTHNVEGWNQDITWLVKVCKSKNWRRHFVQIVVAETIYAVWLNRNDIVFNSGYRDINIVGSVMEKIVNRIWVFPKYRDRVSHPLMP